MSVDSQGAPEPRSVLTAGVRLRVVPGGFPLGALLGGVALVVGAAIRLLHLDRLGFTLCVFKAVTGLPCFTCGGTRVFGRLASLDLAGAFLMNPLLTLASLALPLWTLTDLILLTRGSALGLELGPRVSRFVVMAAVCALILNWAYLIGAGR